MTPPPGGRRAEYAEFTRTAILSAARDLFVRHGYFGTRVEDIARAARVAPATVYAVGGGKSGLLRKLIEDGTTDERQAEFDAGMAALHDPHEVIRVVVEGTGSAFATWSPLMRQVVAAAPREPAVRESMDMAHAGLRRGLARTAGRLDELGALRAGLSVDEATDVLWFHLSNAAYFTLTDDLGWPLPRATGWLRGRLTSALLA
ncbi:TetR/AcrR family transcriptional regulator [Jidongwangia harbinensis]|uniref:TetR/AcrR family transcriptional regulator n=1 Tax=Jidongwangia harbinensis TaxID=2878561 RepID=UPI001CD99EDC|nr:TetR/AcrR family transcriptional regulator [Jidongwangia harbinensis]MCA2212139.1 TetR/AcrR family transcriptional regulator [Jidongwangia harbinensis]